MNAVLPEHWLTPRKERNQLKPSPQARMYSAQWALILLLLLHEKRLNVPSKSRTEKRRLSVARIIQSLPEGATSTLANLDPEIPLYRQQRQCDCCGVDIVPKKPNQSLLRFCGASCNAKWWMQFESHKKKIHTKER